MSAKCHKRTFRPSAHAMVGDGGPERDDQRRRCADQFKSKQRPALTASLVDLSTDGRR
jgi:hypothetical protein